jgi:uncharacterized protein
VLASPFALALGKGSASPTFTEAGAAAAAVWLITVVGAYLMQRRSYRPAETLLRRLTYGHRG